MTDKEILFSLISAEVCGREPDFSVKEQLTQQLSALYRLSDRHDLTHLAGQGLEKIGALGSDEVSEKFRKAELDAVMRYVSLNSEYERTCQALEAAQIPFIPLKGSVLRAYYPEPWMRTSCDIDILVKPENLEKAIAALQTSLGYTAKGRGAHDVSVYAPSGVLIELHYDMVEERYADDRRRAVLQQVWEVSAPREPGSFHYVMPDALFYFYHIAHMAKHFEVGGCGIRSFLDIWILNNRVQFDGSAREALLAQGGLLTFANTAQRLAQVWFSGAQHDVHTQMVSDYILRAGMYGDSQNRAALGQARSGGKLRYLITRRVFMPYRFLKDEYPVLVRHKWLLPACQVARWVRMLRTGWTIRKINELKSNTATTDDAREAMARMIKELEI